MKKLVRELKIKFLLNEEEKLFPISKINPNLFPDKKYNYIISGSFILKMYGLLERKINDIDLVFDTQEECDAFLKDYKLLQNTSGYIDHTDELCKNYLGYITINDFKFDIFLNKYYTKDIIMIDEYRTLNPYKIINHKINFLENELINKKHFKDLLYINTKLN